MAKWILGHNVPGYSPETEPYLVDGILYAVEALIDEVSRVVDTLDSTRFDVEGFDVPSAGDHYNQADLERHLRIVIGDMVDSGAASVYMTEPDREHDLGVIYWMHRASSEEIREWEEEEARDFLADHVQVINVTEGWK